MSSAAPDVQAVPGIAAGHMARLPGAVDHHVHLGLVSRELLAGGPLVEVIDCGWDPDQALSWRVAPPSGVTVEVAGPFHTAVGGYPLGRSWAPDAAVRQIADVDAAIEAVRTAAAAAYDAFKIALNGEMPLLSDAILTTLIGAAHEQNLTVFVHAEGAGQAMRAVRAGADRLVHSPWSERLSDEELQECAAADVVWVSTLAIHEREDRVRAIDNVRRFHRLGGTVLYGTDMGNGPTPVGVNPAELLALEEAGFTGQELRDTILVGEPQLRGALPVPQTASELVTWLKECERV